MGNIPVEPALKVLPASAGMILLVVYGENVHIGAPRIRGDDPWLEAQLRREFRCSPHPRG